MDSPHLAPVALEYFNGSAFLQRKLGEWSELKEFYRQPSRLSQMNAPPAAAGFRIVHTFQSLSPEPEAMTSGGFLSLWKRSLQRYADVEQCFTAFMSHAGLYCWAVVTAAVFREICDAILSDFNTFLTELESDQLVALPRRPWLNTLSQTYSLGRFWTPTKLWDSILPPQHRAGGCFYTTPLQYREQQWFMPTEYAGGTLSHLLGTDQPSTVVALVSDSSGPFVHLCADLGYQFKALTTPLRTSGVMQVHFMSRHVLMIYSLQCDPVPCPMLPIPQNVQPAVRQNALQPMAKAAGGRAYLPQPGVEFTPETGEEAALDERFHEKWKQEVEVRRSALAPRWNGRTRQQVNRRD